MQYDPSKQGYDNYANQYPPMNQPQFGQGNVYPSNAPPAYGQYPQQPGGYQVPPVGYPGQPPLHPQHGFVVTPVHRPGHNLVQTTITRNLRVFLIISGIFCLIWGVMAIGLEIGIRINSYWTSYYRGLWAGGFLLGGGINMLIASCKPSYALSKLTGILTATLCLCIVAVILSAINVASDFHCDSSIYSYCDYTIAVNLKIVMLILFIVAVIHTIINMVVVGNAQKRTSATSPSNVPSY